MLEAHVVDDDQVGLEIPQQRLAPPGMEALLLQFPDEIEDREGSTPTASTNAP